MAEYLLGLVTLPALLFALWIVLSVYIWLRWWTLDHNDQFIGGWGYRHEFQESDPDYYDGRWVQVSHTHWWPPDTPRWLGRWLEPLRVRHCLRDPNRRAAEPCSLPGQDTQ